MSAKVLDSLDNPTITITEAPLESALLEELRVEEHHEITQTARPLAIKTEDLTRIYKVKGQKKNKGEKNGDGSQKTLLASSKQTTDRFTLPE